jgi:hypothetical protein
MFLLVACGRIPVNNQAATSVPTIQATTTDAPAASVPATAATITDEPPAAPATPAATRVGSEYVLLLPREAAVPAGWVMNPTPDYEARQPAPGATYRFACLDLPARSTGVASVGYRSLEGLPSVHVEYVVYPSAEAAAAALADMQQAVEACAGFTIGQGESAIEAALAPLDFPAYGDAGFAMTLSTSSPQTGDLVTHVIKIRREHVIAGISHAGYGDAPPPDSALSESLAALIVSNLEEAPEAED